MGWKHKQPEKHLKFGSLLRIFQDAIQEINDTRNQKRIIYSLTDIYTSAFAMFYLQDSSLLEFQRRFQEKIQQNNLATVFKVHDIPSDTQLRDMIEIHSNRPIMEVFNKYFHRLQRGKQLERYQYINNHYIVVLDGSEYFTSESISCSKCLVKEEKDGTKRYHHQILQSTLVHPDHREVIPFAPEFISNEDGFKKQDCERNVAKRLIKKLKQDHPHLPIIIISWEQILERINGPPLPTLS